MPTASSIQVVNDANGAAYAFLEDNGLLWQCQWNAEAQRWDKGQVVPGAYGGEKLQALYLENLWPTSDSSGNNPGTAPGVVLAYRVGEGSSSQVLATFGRWGSDGQLQWSAPEVLSEPGVEVQAFALAPGAANTASGDGQAFSLVVQAQQAGPSTTAILDQLKGASESEQQALLEELANADRPDSDLYTNSFRLAGADAPALESLQSISTGSTGTTYGWSTGTTLSPAAQEATPASPAPLLGGNTQLSRQALVPGTPSAGGLAAASAAAPGSDGTAPGSIWNAPTAYSGQKGNFRAGALIGQAPTRWEFSTSELTTGESSSVNRSPYGGLSSGLLVFSNKLTQKEFSTKGRTLAWNGSFGTTVNTGGNPFEYSYARLSLAYTEDTGSETIRERKSSVYGLRRTAVELSKVVTNEGYSEAKYAVGLGGSLDTRYNFAKPNTIGTYTGLVGSNPIVGASGRASAGLNGNFKWVDRTITNTTIRFNAAAAFGWAWTQYASNNQGLQPPIPLIADLSSYATYLKYIGTALNFFESTNKYVPKGPNAFGNNGIYLQGSKPWNLAAGVLGTLIALEGPVELQVQADKGFPNQATSPTQYSSANGIQEKVGVSGGYLWHGIVGGRLTLGGLFNQYFSEIDGERKSNTFYIGLAALGPFGIAIPLVSYSITWPNSGQPAPPGSGTAPNASGTGDAYPFRYSPESASNSYFAATPPSGSDVNPSLLGSNQTLQLFTLSAYSGAINPPDSPPSERTAPVTLYNAGSGLKNSTIDSATNLPIPYADVPIVAVGLDGGTEAFAQASFTVQNGSIVANTLQITQGGKALALPESSSGSGIYALLLDVFSSGIASPPSSTAVNPFSNLPLITVDSTMAGTPLQTQAIQRVWSVPVDPLAQQQSQQQAGVIYPVYNANTGQTSPPAANDNGAYSYSDVPVQLLSFSSSSSSPVPLLNGPVSATVLLSNGVIQAVELNEALLFAPPPSGSSTSVQLILPSAVTANLPSSAATPSFAVTPQALAFNNLVADEQFSAQAGAPESGVYLAAGVNDALPLLPQMGAWPVQNRVVYATRGANGLISSAILNGQQRIGAETAPIETAPIPELNPPSLEELYNNPSLIFSAASRPTAATIAGPEGATYSNDTFVAWVEASDPVVPITSSDGSTNYQAYMQALYGKQRINYRLQTAQGWEAPALTDLYAPDGVVITELQAFNVANPDAPGGSSTLLVWSELSIDAIQGTVADVGSGTAIPAVIKAVWIKPNATNIEPGELFSNADGSVLGLQAISTIPWSPEADIGLTIEDISIASQPLLLADGTIAQVPVVSWSQRVRTPYRQSVLNDEPGIYLELGALQTGLNSINLGTIQEPSTTATLASSTGLNFALPGALPKSQAAAVQNIDGTGVLSTGLGSLNGARLQLARSIPTAVAVFSGSISGTTLSVSALAAGRPQVGDGLSGAGVLAGTTITGLISVDAVTGLGTYSVSQSQSVAAVTLQALPQPAGLLSFSGSIEATTLTVTALPQGSLNVGDVLAGQGIVPGTRITAVISPFDATTGQGSYSVDRSQSLVSSALVAAPPVASDPYTLEFWAQLQPGSNPNGAGLVALGQPSAGAIGPAVLPEGWLLGASFVVDRITYQQAVSTGLIEAIPSGTDSTALYGWGWVVVATGADTTAMGGNGGSNLYSNALQINNLVSGVTLEGVNKFLNNYGVSASELIGLNGSTAATLASVPFTQLQFNTFLDSSNSNLPTSNLNGIAVDTNTAAMNGGLLQASDVSNNTNLNSLFTNLWAYQQQTGEAKVSFNLAPGSSNATTTPSATSNEQYSGYELDFTLLNGPAVSVNGLGQLVFDVAPGLSLTSSTGVDLRDGQWHYIAATYLPQYEQSSVNGEPVTLPTLQGSASLLVDGEVVSSNSGVSAAYAAQNLSDQALLLANNAGGGLDQLALYDKALTNAVQPPGVAGVWPQISSDDALAAIAVLGLPLSGQSSSGTIPGAISEHWAARNVTPNDALLATYTSSYDPSSNSWSPAALLNPQLAPQPTTPSAVAPGSLQNDLVIAVPSSSWTGSGWSETGGSSQDGFFNPANQQLQTVTVTLSDTTRGTSTTITLNSDQVLLGGQTLQSLQPQAKGTSLDYTVLSEAPAFSLLIPRDQINLQDSYTATYSFNFADGTSASGTSVSNATPVPVNVFASSVASSGLTSSTVQTTLTNRSQALATAQVLEQAPLQLQYIDSGEVFRSRPSAASTSSKALSNTPESFGQSQVFGSFTDSSGTTNGWLAIAQPSSLNAGSDPAGRIFLQYTGQSKGGMPSSDPAQAPSTWLNALANSNFSPDAPNLPLLGDALYPSTSGGLLIQADPTAGWGQQLGQTMLVADVNNDSVDDLVIAAPAANGGGLVYIVDGSWIQNNLTQNTGSTILNLADPNALGSYITILRPESETIAADGSVIDTSVAGFGTALAFDGTKLWIGAPNVLQQLNPTNTTTPGQSLVPIGAIYSYSSTSASWGSGTPTPLARTYTGTGGTASTPDPTGAPTTSYWGSQLGSAIAISSDGQIAMSAPGVVASLEYSGTQQAQQQASGQKSNKDAAYGDGALLRIQLPSAANNNSVSTTQGINNSGLVPVTGQGTDVNAKSQLANQESAYMQNLKALQSVNIADATVYYNQALQALPVGAVYLFNSSSDLPSSGSSITAGGNGTATFYGAQPWNVLGPSGFGSSLAFADLANQSGTPMLAIGADQAGGSGAVYLVDTSQNFAAPSGWVEDINLESNQYLAYLASGFTLYGAASADNFGNGLVNLGDVNGDSYDDLLIQAFNASEGAGNGYVLFGTDQYTSTTTVKSGTLTINNPASGNVATATIGQMTRADGSTFTASILNELGYGPSAFTGLGSFGPGDVNGDGLPDILLGAGGDASAYLTYGQQYLESITDLQLQKLTSSTGYRLEGLASTTQGSLRSIGDFNDDGYDDFISIQPGDFYTTVRMELGANTEEILADYLYDYYSFTVANGTEVLGAGDINGDGYADIALFLQQNLSSAADGNAGAGSTTGILYGRSSDQLPIGSGFGLQAPVDGASNPLAPLPIGQIPGALSVQAPAMVAVGTTIYAVWCDETGNRNLWFAQSSDGGNSWSSNTNLTAAMPGLASGSTPSLLLFSGKLYLAFLNNNSQVELSSWDPTSGNPSLWSNPTVISGDGTPANSVFSPALIANGDVLSVVWVDESDGTLQGSSSTTPDLSSISGGLGPASAWSQVGDGTSPNTPAIANDGNTVYMAMRGENNQLYWTSSSDGGQSWYGWQELPSSMTTFSAPSLAIAEGELYLTFTGEDESLFVTQLQVAGGNQWSPLIEVPDQTAATGLGAVCIGEIVDGVEGLALYYVASDGTGDIYRTWRSTPLGSDSWSEAQRLGITTSSSNGFTSSSPLAVTRFQGNTVLAYMGDASSTETTAYIATAGESPASSSSWATISSINTGNRLGIGLSSDVNGLLLNTSNSDTNDQSIYRFTPPPTEGGSWSQSFYTNRSSISSSAPTAALLALPSTGSTAQLLLAVADEQNNGQIDVSAFYPQAENSIWSTASPLQQRIDTDGTVSFQPISATAAPSATLLDGTPVLAVNNSGVISVYAGNGTNSLNLASSFSPGSAGLAGDTPAVITSTDTGLALSYGNADGSVSLQRLNLLNLDGTPVEGVQIRPDGSLDTSNANLQWQGIELDSANGLSSGLATVPLNVNGGLLLGSTSNASGSTNQVQLSAIPVLSNSGSTTWLNSTVQLPDGSGGWTIQQLSGGSTGLDANQTGSSLSPVGDLNNDGYADLLVTANNVLLNPGSDLAAAIQATGLRVITGAATGSQILTANDATAASQTVQVAPGFGSSSSTPVASLGASVNGVPTLVLSATNQSSGQGSELQSLPYNTASSWDAIGFFDVGSSVSTPSLAVLGSTVYMAAQAEYGFPTSYLQWASSIDSGQSWSSFQPLPSSMYTDDAPSLAIVDDSVYLVYLGAGSQLNITQLTNASTNTWSAQTILASQSARYGLGAVAISETVDGTTGLAIYYIANNDSGLILRTWSATPLDAEAWTDPVALGAVSGYPGFTASGPLALTSFQGATYLAYPGGTPESASTTAYIATAGSSPQTTDSWSTIATIDTGNFGGISLASNLSGLLLNSLTATSQQQITQLSLANGQWQANVIDVIPADYDDAAVTANQRAAILSVPSSLSPQGQLLLAVNPSAEEYFLSPTLQTSLVGWTSPANLQASAGNLASAQQLFSPTEAPVPGSQGLGLGFGSPALNTTGTYGDLNADGYLDSLVGDTTFAVGVNGMGWHVWSIRAAGDVNGNGTDDVLLSLSPTEVPLTAAGQPQDLQTVLVDGSLFEVDRASNSFSLTSLRVPLDPGAGAGLQGYGGGEGTPATLQFWIQPVQAFQAPAIETAEASSPFTLTNKATDPDGFNSGIATATSDDGVGYVISQGAGNNPPLQFQSVNSLISEVVDLGQITASTLFGAEVSATSFFTLANNGAVFYRGRLYLASYSVVGPDYVSGPLSISSIAIENLTAEGIANSANWSSYTLPSAYASTFAPALVNEGDRLGLYFVSASDNYLSACYAYEPEEGSAAWGAVNNGEFMPGYYEIIQANQGSVTMNPDYTSVDYDLPNIAATRFQGRTVVAAFASANSDNASNAYLLLEQPLAGSSSQWNQYDVSIQGQQTTTPGGLQRSWWLQANATQLFLGAISNGISFSVWGENLDATVASFDVYSSNLGASLLVPGSGLNVFSFYSTGNGGYDAPGAATSTLIPATWLATSGTPITPSLAGYSIDANIDVNGDGFMDMLVSDPSNPAAGLANQYVLFGGDYNQIASQVGTPGNDVMLGTPLADVIYTLQGSDEVSSNGGEDVIYTGAGDDAISIKDNAFIRIHAGSGFDQLQLQGLANQSYDFCLNVPDPEYFAGTKLSDIELISSIDYGANLLSFDVAAINAINSDRVLFVTPDASDSIALTAEFNRNASFDTSFGGTLWSAYAAAPASATPASGNPALIYIRTPDGQSASWLESQVSLGDPAALLDAGQVRRGALIASAPLVIGDALGDTVADPPFLPSTSPIAASTDFGEGLTLVAFRTAPASGLARFAIERRSTSRRQVVAYGSSSASSSAQPGRDYTPIAGLVVLEPGQARQEITVPIDSAAFALLRGGSLSLLVEELVDQGQLHLHLQIAPAASVAPGGADVAAPPVLSGFELVPTTDGTGASLRFRADRNGGSQALDHLQLTVSERVSASSLAVVASQTVSLLDAMANSGDPPPAYNAIPGALALDNDQRRNGKISAQLALSFTAQAGQPAVSLVAPELQWQSSLQLQPNFSLSFSNDEPFTLWRADNGGSGPVSFGLQSGSQTITLLSNAVAGSAGSITPDSALSGDAITGWRATEGLSVGSRGAVDGLALTGTTWTPTASRDGQQLALLDLSQEGNQITASFAEGVTAVFGLQSTGSAPTPTPIRPAVQVQRLAGYDNSLGFYALDSITGMVDGVNPGEAGYLQMALARSEASGLLLSAKALPAYGASQVYTDLPLDPNRNYGALLLVNGNRSRIYSSFAAANPGGAPQVISLGSSSTSLVLGFEDLPATSGDMDYNDLVVNITNVSVPLF